MTKKGGKQKQGGRQKNQHTSKEAIERKRDERTQRNKLKKERKLKEFHGDYTDDDFVNFKRQLDHQGLKLREIKGDGNCLFRALADQLNGDDNLHMRHRKDVVEYMKNHEPDFSPFLDETVTFEKYLNNLSATGTYGGNDSVVAFARKNSVDVIIHQYNSPAFIVNGKDGGCQVKLHLAYHSMEHYSSVRIKDDPGDGPAHMFHRSKLLQKPQGQDKLIVDENKKKETVILNDTPELKENKQKAKNKEKAHHDNHLSMKVQQIKTTTGLQDEGQIKAYLHDNGDDLDATLSFIFQLMALSEPSEEKGEIQTDVFSSEIQSKDAIKLSNEDLRNGNCNEKDIQDILNWLVDSVEDALNSSNDEVVEDIKSTEFSNIDEKSPNDCKCDINGNKNKRTIPGSKKPNNRGKTPNKRHQGSKHLSNRQRKELLKQERKKRREENKRDPSLVEEFDNDDDDNDNGLTTPVDIHVISI